MKILQEFSEQATLHIKGLSKTLNTNLKGYRQ